MRKKIIVENPEEIPTKIIAESIVEISEAIKKLRSGKLNEKGLLVLLAHATGYSQVVVKRVLEGLEDLKRLYTR